MLNAGAPHARSFDALASGPAPTPSSERMQGDVVQIERLALSHADDLYEALRHEDQEALQRYTSDAPVGSLAQMQAQIAAKLGDASRVYMALIDRRSGVVSGHACYMRIDCANRVLEIGNVLLTRRLRHRRPGTEAMYLLLRRAFEDCGYRRVEWKCDDLNAPSRNAALRLGFSFEGVFRQHMIVKGRNRDTAWFSMLDHQWPMRRDAFAAWLAPSNFDAEGRQRVSLSSLNGLGSS